jgi:hypothetical protein
LHITPAEELSIEEEGYQVCAFQIRSLSVRSAFQQEIFQSPLSKRVLLSRNPFLKQAVSTVHSGVTSLEETRLLSEAIKHARNSSRT